MKTTCDLCGHPLAVNPGGTYAVCTYCGLEYPEAVLLENQGTGEVPAVKTPPVRKPTVSKKPPAQASKAQKKMKIMWIILAAIGLYAFVGTICVEAGEELTVFLVSLVALLLTLFIFKPWKVYGGNEK